MCWATLSISHTSVECRACEGRGFRDLGVDELKKWYATIAAQTLPEHKDEVRQALSYASICPVCHGCGHTTARRADHATAMDSMFTTVRCGLCRGGAEVTNPTDTSAERQDVCLRCGGRAYIIPVTARASKQMGQGGGGSATDDDSAAPVLPATATTETRVDLDDRRAVAKALAELRASDAQLAAALASYHGPESDPWVGHRWTRAFVLWQHTAAGKMLVEEAAEQSPARSGYLVAPTKLLADIRAAQESTIGTAVGRADARKRVLLGRADREARELLQRLEATLRRLEDAAA